MARRCRRVSAATENRLSPLGRHSKQPRHRTPIKKSSGSSRIRSSRRKTGPLFECLVALQTRLRAPNGCPWDREQTHDSLRTYLIEEAYEVLEALDSGDPGKLSEELGDLLLQIVFHAEIAREAGRFDVGNVIEQVHTKMVRRHPHVFGKLRAKDSAQVLKNWEHLKATERAQRLRESTGQASPPKNPSLMDGLPRTLPAVLEAYQLTRRASRVGFDWEHMDGLFDKLREETNELREALASRGPAATEEEAGDLLFVAVNIARFLNVDPEIALKKTNRKFVARFKQMEAAAAQSGQPLAKTSKDELERLWEAAKGKEAVHPK